MSVNSSRRLGGDLAEGATDGTYKKVVTRERGGVVEDSTYLARRQLDDAYYGFHEARAKVLGDGTVHVTPEYVPTPAPNAMRF